MIRLAALLALAPLACAAPQKNPEATLESLQEAVEAYNHAFRWKNYAQAVMFVPADLRDAFLAAYEDDQSSLQVEDFRVASVKVIDSVTARVVVRIRYMMLPSVIVQRATLTQHWHKIAGRWVLETEDGALRELDATTKPTYERKFETGDVAPEQEGDTVVEVEGPGDEPETPVEPGATPEPAPE